MRFNLLIFALSAILWAASLYFYINPKLIDASAWLKVLIGATLIFVSSFFSFFVEKSFKKHKIAVALFLALIIIILWASLII